MGNIGPMELVIVLVIALVVLGPKRLPEVGKSVGRGMREFKDGLSGHGDDDDEPVKALAAAPVAVAPAPDMVAAAPVQSTADVKD